MSTANVKLVGQEKTRFEVISQGRKSEAQRWYIKANHPSEASKWINALQRSTTWSQERVRELQVEEFLSRPGSSLHSNRRKQSSFSGTSVGENDDPFADGSGSSSSSSIYKLNDSAPHNSMYELHGNNIAAHAELVEQLATSIQLTTPSAPSSDNFKTLLDSLSSLRTMISQYSNMTRDREDWWKVRLAREKERAVVWEESLGIVVREGEVLERELRNTLRSKKTGRRSTAGLWDDGTLAGSLSEDPQQMKILTPVSRDDAPPAVPEKQNERRQSVRFDPSVPEVILSDETKTAMRIEMPPSILTETDYDTEGEDEFFDAIESNTLPGLVTTPLDTASATDLGQLSSVIDLSQYSAYTHLRKKMPIGADNRPAISLWSVLKNNIGKDLTKISFPVTFNEPTSMLQRMVGTPMNETRSFLTICFRRKTWSFLNAVCAFIFL